MTVSLSGQQLTLLNCMTELTRNRYLLVSLSLCAAGLFLERCDMAAVAELSTARAGNMDVADDGWRRTTDGWVQLPVTVTQQGLSTTVRTLADAQPSGSIPKATRRFNTAWPLALAASECFFLMWCIELARPKN
ncbi:MAG: hypothetical protein U0892_00420 [Pirellulales bacterium]